MYSIDWFRYHELSKKTFEEMTPEELEFHRYMYHVEEHEAGLDGDEYDDCDDE